MLATVQYSIYCTVLHISTMFRNQLVFVLLIAWLAVAARICNAAHDAASTTLKSSLSDFYILLLAGSSPIEAHAASSLANISGLSVQATLEDKSSGKNAIAVGAAAAAKLGQSSLLAGLGDEGFTLHTTVTGDIIASGGMGAARGSLYAVYGLLEELGWRFWTAESTRAPEQPVFVPKLQLRSLPALEYRETNNVGARLQSNQEWAAGPMRFNGDAFSGAKKPGGGVRYSAPGSGEYVREHYSSGTHAAATHQSSQQSTPRSGSSIPP